MFQDDVSTPEPAAAPAARARRKPRPAHEVRERNRRLVTWALLLGSFILIVNALVGEHGYLAVIRARQEYRTAADELKRLAEENQRHLDEIRDIKNDPAALERRRAPRAGSDQARRDDRHHSRRPPGLDACSAQVVSSLVDFVLHFDKHLLDFISAYGAWVYALLFGIVFAETGFVVTPFLPGDSLLFAAGAAGGDRRAERSRGDRAPGVRGVRGERRELRDRPRDRPADLSGDRRDELVAPAAQPRSTSRARTRSSSSTAARPSCSAASCRSSARSCRSSPARRR